VFGIINYHIIEIESQNLIVLVEFLVKLTSNDGFQLFPTALLSYAPENDSLD